jgi:hypothetical protein
MESPYPVQDPLELRLAAPRTRESAAPALPGSRHTTPAHDECARAAAIVPRSGTLDAERVSDAAHLDDAEELNRPGFDGGSPHDSQAGAVLGAAAVKARIPQERKDASGAAAGTQPRHRPFVSAAGLGRRGRARPPHGGGQWSLARSSIVPNCISHTASSGRWDRSCQ